MSLLPPSVTKVFGSPSCCYCRVESETTSPTRQHTTHNRNGRGEQTIKRHETTKEQIEEEQRNTLTRHCTQQKPRNLPSNTRCLCEGGGYNTVPFHAFLVSPIATSTFFLDQPYIQSFSYLPTTTGLHGIRNDLSIYLGSRYLSRYI